MRVPLLICVFFAGVFLSSRLTGACPLNTDLIMQVNVTTTTIATTATTTIIHCKCNKAIWPSNPNRNEHAGQYIRMPAHQTICNNIKRKCNNKEENQSKEEKKQLKRKRETGRHEENEEQSTVVGMLVVPFLHLRVSRCYSRFSRSRYVLHESLVNSPCGVVIKGRCLCINSKSSQGSYLR